AGWILEQLTVHFEQGSGDRGKEIGGRLGGFNMPDLLELDQFVAGVDVPVEEVHVLHEPHGVAGEPKPQAQARRRVREPAGWFAYVARGPAPHVIASVEE